MQLHQQGEIIRRESLPRKVLLGLLCFSQIAALIPGRAQRLGNLFDAQTLDPEDAPAFPDEH